jgi:hypothetical protein
MKSFLSLAEIVQSAADHPSIGRKKSEKVTHFCLSGRVSDHSQLQLSHVEGKTFLGTRNVTLLPTWCCQP